MPGFVHSNSLDHNKGERYRKREAKLSAQARRSPRKKLQEEND
jgi:hypothetical protein